MYGTPGFNLPFCIDFYELCLLTFNDTQEKTLSTVSNWMSESDIFCVVEGISWELCEIAFQLTAENHLYSDFHFDKKVTLWKKNKKRGIPHQRILWSLFTTLPSFRDAKTPFSVMHQPVVKTPLWNKNCRVHRAVIVSLQKFVEKSDAADPMKMMKIGF